MRPSAARSEMRLIFAGTPTAAVPSLQRLLASDHEVVAVLTRPDARAGRGRRTAPSPVREVADAAGVPVLTPTSLRDPQIVQTIMDLAPQCCPVVAYGNLVPAPLLDLPEHGWVNLHFSLLPAWRGAAPVQHAIIAGDRTTGASVFRLDAGLDTGPVLASTAEPIRPEDTAGDLLARLAEIGADLLLATLDSIAAGAATATAQPADGASLAPKLLVEDAHVQWSDPAVAIDRLIRGCSPAPGAWTTFRGERVKLDRVQLVDGENDSAAGDNPPLGPGELDVTPRRVRVGTGAGLVELGIVRAAGKKPMPAADWARGVRPEVGEVFE